MSRVVKTLTDFRDQNDEELRALLATTRDDLFRLKLGQHTNQVTSTADLVNKRRDIPSTSPRRDATSFFASNRSSVAYTAPTAISRPVTSSISRRMTIP